MQCSDQRSSYLNTIWGVGSSDPTSRIQPVQKSPRNFPSPDCSCLQRLRLQGKTTRQDLFNQLHAFLDFFLSSSYNKQQFAKLGAWNIWNLQHPTFWCLKPLSVRSFVRWRWGVEPLLMPAIWWVSQPNTAAVFWAKPRVNRTSFMWVKDWYWSFVTVLTACQKSRSTVRRSFGKVQGVHWWFSLKKGWRLCEERIRKMVNIFSIRIAWCLHQRIPVDHGCKPWRLLLNRQIGGELMQSFAVPAVNGRPLSILSPVSVWKGKRYVCFSRIYFDGNIVIPYGGLHSCCRTYCWNCGPLERVVRNTHCMQRLSAKACSIKQPHFFSID